MHSHNLYPNTFVFEEQKTRASSFFFFSSFYFSLEISCHISTLIGTMIVILTVLNLGRKARIKKTLAYLSDNSSANHRKNRNVEINCVFGLISLANVLMKKIVIK
jgi:hypothetical protein